MLKTFILPLLFTIWLAKRVLADTNLTIGTDKMYVEEPWHASIEALWSIRLAPVANIAVYPFADGLYSDFEPVFESLIASYPNTSANGFDGDLWAAPFLDPAADLVTQADDLKAQGNSSGASALYLRAAAMYRVARFPWYGPSSTVANKQTAWTKGKDAYVAGLNLTEFPIEEFLLPLKDRQDGEGENVPVWVSRTLNNTSNALPTVLVITGLDGYRTDQTAYIKAITGLGYTAVVLEMPGTGDCPITAYNATGDSRLWDTVLEWMQTKPERFDLTKLIALGLSTGGYWAYKVAYTHKDWFLGVVGQGGGSHYMFSQEWLENVDHLGYLTDLWQPLADAWGYSNKTEFAANGMQYSLLEQGLLNGSNAPLFVVNGLDDTVFPIDDELLLLKYGDPKEVRWFPGQEHMADPDGDIAALVWIADKFQAASA